MRHITLGIILVAILWLTGIYGCTEENLEQKSVFKGESEWQTNAQGLPDAPHKFAGLAVWQEQVVAAIEVEEGKGTGLYHVTGGAFQKIADAPNGYGFHGLAVTSDGKLFTSSVGVFWQLTGSSGNYRWRKLETKKEFSGRINYVADRQGDLIVHNNTTDPEIIRLHTDDGSYSDLEFPFTGLDGKPHIQLKVATKGAIWYKSNYSGIFRYDGSSWSKVNENSGKLSIAADGAVYLSYEVKKATQISTFFRYEGGTKWQQVHIHQGYGIGGAPIGDGNHVVCASGRFGQFIVSPGKKWTLPSLTADLNLSSHEMKGVRVAHMLTHRDQVYLVQDLGMEGYNPRLLNYSPDTVNSPFYTNNLQLQTGTYLTPDGAGEAVGTGILADGRIAVALNADPNQFSVQPKKLYQKADGQGLVLILSADGSTVNDLFIADEKIYDLDIPANSNSIGVAGSSQYGRIDVSSGDWAWNAEYTSDKKRIALNAEAQAAVIIENGTVRLHDTDGTQINEKSHQRSYTEDVEMAANGQGYFIVGFDNKSLPGGNPVQVAYLNFYNTQGAMEWQRFGFDGGNLSSNIADTRLYRVKRGLDGQIHILGESAGSQTIFRYDGQSYSGEEFLSQVDFYNALWNTGSAHIAYHAKLQPASGKLTHSQLTMSRLSEGKSNSFRVGDIHADAGGSVFITGKNSYQMANRAAQRINSQYIGAYHGDPSLLAVSPNYQNRHAWTSFSQDMGTGMGKAIATDNNKVVALFDAEEGQFFTTSNAAYSSGSGVYLAVLPIHGNFK